MKRLLRSPFLFVVVASLAFSTSGPLARLARPTSPLIVAFGRVFLAAILLFAVDARTSLASLRALSRNHRRTIAIAGALLAGHFALFLGGLDTTSLPAALALVSLEPLSVVLAAWLIAGVRPTRGEGVGVILATIGGLIVGSGAGQGDHRLSGDLMVVGAVVLYGFYVASARSVRDALPARTYAASVYLFAASVLFVVVASFARQSPAISSRSVVAIVALALIPTIIGHTMVQSGSRTLSPSTIALVSPGEALGGIAIGAVLFHAIPTLRDLEGAAFILAGALIAMMSVPPAEADHSRENLPSP